jgi:hypothetical protein
VRDVFKYISQQQAVHEQAKHLLAERVRRIVIRNNFQINRQGFLQFPDLSEQDCLQFMKLFDQADCFPHLLQLCLIEDLNYNLLQSKR